jgi:hypothetical protein
VAGCGASCPSFDDPAEALREATDNPPEDCVARWSSYVCTWTAADHERRRVVLEEARAQGKTAQIEELHCGCLASATEACFVTMKKRGSNEYTFITTGAPGCENATLPVASPDHIQVPGSCGFSLAVKVGVAQ